MQLCGRNNRLKHLSTPEIVIHQKTRAIWKWIEQPYRQLPRVSIKLPVTFHRRYWVTKVTWSKCFASYRNRGYRTQCNCREETRYRNTSKLSEPPGLTVLSSAWPICEEVPVIPPDPGDMVKELEKRLGWSMDMWPYTWRKAMQILGILIYARWFKIFSLKCWC